MALAYLPALAALLGVGLLAWITGQRPWYFTSDPFVLGHLPFYAGILSNVGILLWSASAAICFFTATVVKALPHAHSLLHDSLEAAEPQRRAERSRE
jgi:hypothetical protein